jgi:RNA polymerase-binding transcription factor DksA
MDVTALEARQMLLQRRSMLARTLPGAAQEMREGERAELAEIDAALERIAEGTFGSCVRCGGAIGHQRLRAVPETPYCLACRG